MLFLQWIWVLNYLETIGIYKHWYTARTRSPEKMIMPLSSSSEGHAWQNPQENTKSSPQRCPILRGLSVAQWLLGHSRAQTVLQESLNSDSFWPLFPQEMLQCSRKPVYKSILVAKPLFYWGLSVCLPSWEPPWLGGHLANRATRATGCGFLLIGICL